MTLSICVPVLLAITRQRVDIGSGRGKSVFGRGLRFGAGGRELAASPGFLEEAADALNGNGESAARAGAPGEDDGAHPAGAVDDRPAGVAGTNFRPNRRHSARNGEPPVRVADEGRLGLAETARHASERPVVGVSKHDDRRAFVGSLEAQRRRAQTGDAEYRQVVVGVERDDGRRARSDARDGRP